MAWQHRLVLAFLTLSLVVIVSQAAKSPKDVIIGSRQPGDRLSRREFVKKDSQWLQIVKLQQTFSTDYGRITHVRLLDQNLKGNGATATVLAGGPGEAYITVKFESVRSHSINYIVEIYAK